MTTARFIVGDTRAATATIPDGSIDLVMTSPPFLALRSYLPADHPDKHREIGSEPDPATFLQMLLELTAEWGRVLAPHGSIAVELGDTYSGSGGAGGDYDDDGLREGQERFLGSARRRGEWPLAKSLCGIPHLYHLSLAYGRNLLTGEESPAGKWRVRNVIAWCRPNPPVGALGDKYRPATSYMTIACRETSRYFDLDAVRGPGSPNTHARTAKGVESRPSSGKKADDDRTGGNRSTMPEVHETNGAPPLDYWVIPTAPYSGSHYAVYPPALVERPIKSMVPLRVCTVCGEPSRRIVSEPEYVKPDGSAHEFHGDGFVDDTGTMANRRKVTGHDNGDMTRTTRTIGWSECECPDDGTKWRPGVVLDPFAGSGTTLMVATGHGRDAIGIDIDHRNVALARDRVGPLLFTEETLDEARTKAEEPRGTLLGQGGDRKAG